MHEKLLTMMNDCVYTKKNGISNPVALNWRE